MKKKLLALALAVLMAAGACGAVAAEGTLTAPGTQGSNLSYEVAQTFTVTIPESTTITAGSGSGEVSVADAVIPFGKNLTVTITAAANYAQVEDGPAEGFKLRDGSNANYISYTIKKGGVDVAKDVAFLTVAAGTATGSATLNYAAGTATISGTYTDTLTFAVAIAD